MKKTKKTKISSDKIKLIIKISDIFLYYEIEFIINKNLIKIIYIIHFFK